MIKRFYELQEKIIGYYPEANIGLLKKAYAVSTDAHLNQRRASDEPYIIHPLAVAGILADMKLDEISIAAGLLHDVIEDSSYTIEDINRQFGKEIADIVWGVTKISKISDINVEEAQAETLKKMIIAMTKDIRVILIKLADRLHNVRTLAPLDPDKRLKIARETVEIYAPIAYRLGIGKIKDELEDISFMYLHPAEYEKIKKEVADKNEWALAQLEKMKKELVKLLAEYHIAADIQFRIKRPISIYRKTQRQNIELDQVYDLLALRVITDTVPRCYLIVSGVQQRWPYIPSRWRDFISNPKSNFYQSIHTTIITPEAKFEIQVRTQEMHKVAEEGIAAHWRYKEGLSFLEKDVRLQWFREMIEHHKSSPDPKEFLSLVKKDLTPQEIYVFTPKGKVINLKAGSTPLDFAYAIHSEIGDHCRSAIVNEKMVPLKTRLNSGDVVEILTAKNAKPSSDWLKVASTTRARKKILAYLQKEENARHLERGLRIWAKIQREYQKKFQQRLDADELRQRIAGLGYPDNESFFRDIGSGKRTVDKQLLKALYPDVSAVDIKPPQKTLRKPVSIQRLISVEGNQDIDFSFAKCCLPIKGDVIVGYITQNRGLVIHHQDCLNIKGAMPSRLKEVSWNPVANYLYLVHYNLIVSDRPGMLKAITEVTAAYESNIKKIEIIHLSQSLAKVRLSFEVREVSQLHEITQRMRNLNGVYSLIRKRK